MVGFDTQGVLSGIFLNFDEGEKPVRFLPPFSELPEKPFIVRDLIDLMNRHSISFEDNRGERARPMILTEGGVIGHTVGSNCSPKALIWWLHSYGPTDS